MILIFSFIEKMRYYNVKLHVSFSISTLASKGKPLCSARVCFFHTPDNLVTSFLKIFCLYQLFGRIYKHENSPWLCLPCITTQMQLLKYKIKKCPQIGIYFAKSHNAKSQFGTAVKWSSVSQIGKPSSFRLK